MNISALLAPLLLLGSGSVCPVGWTDAGGEFCYLTSPNKMNWHTAQAVIQYIVQVFLSLHGVSLVKNFPPVSLIQRIKLQKN